MLSGRSREWVSSPLAGRLSCPRHVPSEGRGNEGGDHTSAALSGTVRPVAVKFTMSFEEMVRERGFAVDHGTINAL